MLLIPLLGGVRGGLNKTKGSIFKDKIMLEINNISKTYRRGSAVFLALEDVTIKIEKGDYVAVTGASGAGKSTLLNIIGGLIHPDSGEVLYNGKDIYKQNGRVTNEYRKKHVGFIFQQFHLMPYLTVLENVKLACYEKEHFAAIDGYFEMCNLTSLINKNPSGLSVGEKQRAAFVRAIISSPEILLADEPTGNLDPGNTEILMSLIETYHKNGGTVVMVSHDPSIVRYANRQISLDRGEL